MADGFGPVADAFTRNFDRHGEVGAAVAAFVDGRLVVDLYAGMADPAAGRDWTRDTTAVMYSCGKGIVALCVYQLVQEGRLDLNAPMARYWPEFGQSGKQDVTVRCVLARALAESAPLWPPGNAHAYHPLTYGWLAGELIRLVSGLMPGEFFAARFGRPLGLSTWIGVPESELGRVARVLPGAH